MIAAVEAGQPEPPSGFEAFVEEPVSGFAQDHQENGWDCPAYPDLPAPGGLPVHRGPGS
ncbi:hypothetical protein ABZZ36_40980 [Actinacidiphila glaucinigra]|uniref:hypothetical protein n=1 Tax=Actinacidiphila glaucinigra TaxID=235986 RepID=UPI0033BF4E98